jgi:hypothetical protein
MMNILAVSVNSDGSIYQNPGGGITVQRREKGIYVINFPGQFSAPPVVVTTQNYPAWNSAVSDHGYPSDNSVLLYVDEGQAIVLVGSDAQGALDRNFTAIISGNSAQR